MTVSIPDYEAQFAATVRSFWEVRQSQGTDNLAGAVPQAGTRGQVTGGKHLASLTSLIHRVFAEAGMPSANPKKTILPGYYRIAKNWDVVVIYKDQIVAIIELKSHVGSFGNNQNNRIEEMIGQSQDIWIAARQNLLGGIRPWFGYLMLAEDHIESSRPIKGRQPVMPPDSIFQNTNYLDRYQIAFERLRAEGDMNAACLLYSDQTTRSVRYPDSTMTFNAFAAAIHARVIEVLGMLGP